MPTKVREYSMYAPGSLVRSTQAIYSTDPTGRIPLGTVGTILRGPEQGYENHCQVQFVSLHDPWWVNYNEIEPYALKDMDS